VTRDPFLRLALIVAVTLYVVGLTLADQWFGWAWTVAAGVAGVLGAVGLSVDVEHAELPTRDDLARLAHRLRFKPELARRLRRQAEQETADRDAEAARR